MPYILMEISGAKWTILGFKGCSEGDLNEDKRLQLSCLAAKGFLEL